MQTLCQFVGVGCVCAQIEGNALLSDVHGPCQCWDSSRPQADGAVGV